MKRIAMLLAMLGITASAAVFTSSPASAHVDLCVGTGNATLGAPITAPTGPSVTTSFVFNLNGVCVSGGTLSATGTVSGWCGLSSGEGITNSGHRFSWIGLGGTLEVTGEVIATVEAVPNVAGGESCVTGADNFIVSGEAVLVHCQSSKSKSKEITVTPQGVWITWTKTCNYI